MFTFFIACVLDISIVNEFAVWLLQGDPEPDVYHGRDHEGGQLGRHTAMEEHEGKL